MKYRLTLLIGTILILVSSGAYALYSIADTGKWPNSWSKELEPLRAQSRTAVGPMILQQHFDIPFADKKSFEAAWPHLLNVKSNGAPVFLLRGPHTWVGSTIKAGVRIHSPPQGSDPSKNPEKPIAGVVAPRVRWMNTTYIELIVDGNIVDLNAIPFPAETPIFDERFNLDTAKP